LEFETDSLQDLDWILKWNSWVGLGFEKPISVHLLFILKQCNL